VFHLVRSVLDRGKQAELTVSGNSMYPLIRHLQDSVILEKIDYTRVKVLDILLVRRGNGTYVLHRVCRRGKVKFSLVGDNQRTIEGFVCAVDEVIAKVVSVKRGGRVINPNAGCGRLYGMVWLMLLPFRHILLNIAGKALKWRGR
jgi:hypothetical protein